MTLPGMKTLAFLLILSCAACTEMKPMSDFGMAVYNSKPERLENYRGRFKVGAIVAPEEPETFRSAVELSLSENQLLAPDLEKERYVIDVNFEKIDRTDISSAEIRVEVTISYSVHQIQPKKPVLADKIVIVTTVSNPSRKTIGEARAGMIAIALLTGGAGVASMSAVKSIAAKQHRKIRENAVREAL
jgi:hypothetical protein